MSKYQPPSKKKLSSTMTMVSEDGTPIRVPLPDGRTLIIKGTPRAVPRHFVKAALAAGALPTGNMTTSEVIRGVQVPVEQDPARRREAIRDLILQAVDASDNDENYEGAFTQAGIPNVNWLSDKLDFKVSASERDEIWTDLQRKADQHRQDNEGESEGDDVGGGEDEGDLSVD